MAVARIVLASASPRRRELLSAAGLVFDVAPADVDETLEPFSAPEHAAVALAERKALASARAWLSREPRASGLVVGADTIVAVQAPGEARWSLLGKPTDEHDAARMLAWLSNSRHQVITGVCVARCPDLVRHAAFERTWVSMRAISATERAAYVATGEWRDKAGGYAIQESADAFVVALEEGGFDNVVGLPVALTLELLRRAAP